ncbi:MAG: 23S rRNA (uracil(1939)-C(5))-methyltransferase RlmD, partial [Eggerthellaceae bacterium]
NAELNDLGATSSFIARDATEYMLEAAHRGDHVDVLVMDPPRAGSTPEFLDAASSLAPRRIVYISCSPHTQVRDLEHLGRAGYRLERLTPVDLFPHTEHVETVAILIRP